MKLTLIGLFIIIIIMLLVQISFRDNFSIIDQKAFRKDQINYNLKHLTLVQSDGKEIECGELNSDKTNINKKTICEGYQSMAQNKYAKSAEKCSIVNGIKDWRVRANRIPEITLDGTKGCGFCYDTKNVYYGDENGPFKNVGPVVCNNWIKPGSSGIGGSSHTKNIFGAYPFEDDLYKKPSNKNLQFGQGVVKDTIKMYEQDLCKQMKNCGDQNLMGTDGKPLCGWCATGRKGDGTGEGMVRRGGKGIDQNETKYDDDFCHWPREINEKGQKTFLYKKETKELKKWRELSGKDIPITIGDLSGQTIKLDNPGRLMNGLKHCAASAQLFPCFPNFTGTIANENGEIKHSKRCYDDIWRDYALYKDGNIDIDCDGDIVERIDDNLPKSRTFTLWDKTFIPSVETAVQKIPERMETTKQYDANYPAKDGTMKKKDSKEWFLQWMFSAFKNSKACKDEEPNSCNDKYRSRDYNFFRPKKCIDDIIEKSFLKHSINNYRSNDYFKTDPENNKHQYIPGNEATYPYYWPVYNDPIWKEGIHFDWSDDKFEEKLKQKWDDLNKIQNCKTKGNVNENYDKVLVAVKYLSGTEKKDMDMDIIEELKAKLWQDDDGGTGKSWVKMCWEDFRLKLKKVWATNDPSFINKKGQINITDYPDIINLIMDDSKFYHRVLSYKDKSTGMDVPVELTTHSGGPTYITKRDYHHKYFPFWRLWKNETKYYITSKYINILQEEEVTKLTLELASRDTKNKYASTQYELSLK
jgi:hypothetical protein